jgi:hypothetical protein
MSYPGYHKITTTGPQADIEHLLVQMEESIGGDRYLCLEDPERKVTHCLRAVEERRDGASLILDLEDKHGPNYRVLELISERFPALTIDGTIDCLDWDLFRIKVFCHGGKVAFLTTSRRKALTATFLGYSAPRLPRRLQKNGVRRNGMAVRPRRS